VRAILCLASTVLPWSLRRRLLNLLPGVELHPGSRIGLSIVCPRGSFVLEEDARIGHLNVIWNIDRLHLGRESRIGQLNWVSAIKVEGTRIFDAYPDRRAELILGACAGITQRHYLDCSDAVRLDAFALLGGVRSTVLAHHMNPHTGRQGCAPVTIGCYSMASTNCVLLGGAVLPDHSILGARSLLIDEPGPPYRLYVGAPARPAKEYPKDLAWFMRERIRTF
jgi:acetyltransferase-like isoleucine patch superfamily enzyme